MDDGRGQRLQKRKEKAEKADKKVEQVKVTRQWEKKWINHENVPKLRVYKWVPKPGNIPSQPGPKKQKYQPVRVQAKVDIPIVERAPPPPAAEDLEPRRSSRLLNADGQPDYNEDKDLDAMDEDDDEPEATTGAAVSGKEDSGMEVAGMERGASTASLQRLDGAA